MTGDYSDVRVIDGEGTEWSWRECSHIDQDEMKALMQDCVSRVYTYLTCGDDEDVHAIMCKHDRSIAKWDRPKLSKSLLGTDLTAKMLARLKRDSAR